MKDQLIRKFPPQPREVWYVIDLEVRLHAEKRIDKDNRPVLVVCSPELTKPDASIINIIPLTTAKKPDKFIFPIDRAYEKCEADFNLSTASCAHIQFYQPIEIQHFVSKCGKIDETSYEAIKNILCTQVIGFCDYDLTID